MYQHIGEAAFVDSPLDIDRDGSVAYADMFAAYQQIGLMPTLQMITVPEPVGQTGLATAEEVQAAGTVEELSAPDPIEEERPAGAVEVLNAASTAADSQQLVPQADRVETEPIRTEVAPSSSFDTVAVGDGQLAIAEPSTAAPADQLLLLEPSLTSSPEAESLPPVAILGIQTPAPLATTAAHDAVLEAATLPTSQSRETLLAKLAWQCRFEQFTHHDRGKEKDRLAEQAVDFLSTFSPP
jgi:hypothetical protein